jgi:hypothetical protein
MSDRNVKDNEIDNRAIQWARESLRRRRIELREQKEALIASYQRADGSASSIDTNAKTTKDEAIRHPMIEDGLSLLAEADAHSEILRRYASFRDGIILAQTPPRGGGDLGRPRSTDSTIQDDVVASRVVEGTDRVDEGSSESMPTRSIVSDLQVAFPYYSREYEYKDSPTDEEDGPNDGDEARARLDELIAAVSRLRGDDAEAESEGDTPTRRIANFDPSSMNATRRAAGRKTKLDMEVAAAMEEALSLTSFKALPLPGGVEVKNNIFASTQAFQGKQIDKLVQRGLKCKMNDNDEPSSLSETTFGECDAAFANEADREQERISLVKKELKKKQLLDSINKIILDEMQPVLVEEEGGAIFDESVEIVEDPLKLLHDISQLKARIKQKKTQRLEILNDIVEIDLAAPFDRLISRNAGVEIRCIIDRLKKRVYGAVSDQMPRG